MGKCASKIYMIEEPESTVDQKFSNYIFLQILGVGGCGFVLKVYDKINRINLVLKVQFKKFLIKFKDSNNDISVTNEVKILKKLNHPLIMDFKGSFQTTNYLCILSSYDKSVSLSKIYECVDQSSAIQIFCEIVSATNYLHVKKIIHRDLKMDNFVYCYPGHIKMIDFGSAVYVDTEHDDEFFIELPLYGTYKYMAPEINIYLGKHFYTKHVDWWSVGIIFYKLLKKEYPYDTKSHKELFDVSELSFDDIELYNMYKMRVEFFKDEIKNLKLDNITNDLSEIIIGLLEVERNKRWDFFMIANSKYLKDIPWKLVEEKKMISFIKDVRFDNLSKQDAPCDDFCDLFKTNMERRMFRSLTHSNETTLNEVMDDNCFDSWSQEHIG